MRTAAFFALLTAGCGLSVVGFGVSDDGGVLPEDEAGTQTPPQSDAAVLDTSAPRDEASTSDVAVDAPACDPEQCEGKRCENNGCSFYPDCKGLHAGMPSLTTGIHHFRRSPESEPFRAYCDMAVEGGGWTLVGQSGAGAQSPFGWSSALGNVDVPNAAYSINAIDRGLVVNEVLVARGSRTDMRTIYVLTPPQGFPGAFAGSDAPVLALRRVKNPDCTGVDAEKPGMFGRMGRTSRTDTFYFRDVGGDDDFGLNANRWELNFSNNCEKTGWMHQESGLVFVR